MKRLLILLAVVLMAASAVPGYFGLKHRTFTQSFHVSAPWFMDQDERDIIQPFVALRLKELKKQVDDVKGTTCLDVECVQKKLTNFRSAKKLLDDATSAASNFSMDTPAQPATPPPGS